MARLNTEPTTRGSARIKASKSRRRCAVLCEEQFASSNGREARHLRGEDAAGRSGQTPERE
jgi:hypothetical protein